jgi:prophage regulatory protein
MVKFLDWDDLRARGIKGSKTHINRLVREGLFPRPVKLGYSTKVWVESEIDEYQASVIAARDAKYGTRLNQDEAKRGRRPAECRPKPPQGGECAFMWRRRIVEDWHQRQ